MTYNKKSRFRGTLTYNKDENKNLVTCQAGNRWR